MNETHKNSLLEAAKQHIERVRLALVQAREVREAKGQQLSRSAISMNPGDAIAARKLHAHNMETVENLKQLYPSPYFSKCEFVVDGKKKILYFGKFSFGEEHIYSWVTPAAALRFENTGPAGYKRPDGKMQSGILESKDQYVIVDGNLKFYATESIAEPRQLVYQENFTTKKGGFMLPEVVEKMEKAQDQVIRAPWRGPFLITGPAGSGKTTLALHRVAYLMQAPETAEYFTPDTILVLVQDPKTKDYFSRLLPDLGIKNVNIQTFTEWALTILELEGFQGDESGVYDTNYSYQQAKLAALRSSVRAATSKNIFTFLNKQYAPYFTTADKAVFAEQQKNNILDRFDLTLLLQNNKLKNGGLYTVKEYYEESAKGTYRKKKSSFPIILNLAIVDEFQNYLPEQLELINGVLNPRLQSAVYVGDVNQQTRLGTIRSLSDMTITISEDRKVVLEKVYRNTKEILAYINTQGFSVPIPHELKNGPAVVTKQFASPKDECVFIAEQLAVNTFESVAILAKDVAALSTYKKYFVNTPNVFCFSYQESQGLEFDAVFMVGKRTTKKNENAEISKIEQDLLYIALTRAMRQLIVLAG